MTTHLVLFTQPGCLPCELLKVYLEAREVPYEQRDITVDAEARRTMTEKYESGETPTLVLVSEREEIVVTGFDPEQLDHVLAAVSSSIR
jgi:glutaredoxin